MSLGDDDELAVALADIIGDDVDLGASSSPTARRLAARGYHVAARSRLRTLRKTLLPIPSARVPAHGHAIATAAPQVPFKGQWFYTCNCGPEVHVVDIKVGQCSVFPAVGEVPARAWDVSAYVAAYCAALAHVGGALTAKTDEEIARALFGFEFPGLDHLRLDFPAATPGNLVQVQLANTGDDEQLFEGAVFGVAIYESWKYEDPAAAPPTSPAAPARPVAPSTAPTVPAPALDPLAASCPECGAASATSCYGLPKPNTHKRRNPKP
jgi:hypothetical protein